VGTPFARARTQAAGVTSETPVRAVEATHEHGAALTELFRRADIPCHCRYWHFTGATNSWLDRCAHAVDVNRDELLDALERRSAEASGVVALAGDRVVGWLKLAPAESVPKLYAQRLYRGLPCFSGARDGVFAVGCLLVDPEARRAGIAGALLDRAVELARSKGGRAIEAFPRRAEPMSDAEAWTGPLSLFTKRGFEIVHDFAPYPVMRLAL
jgi:GNAT superfamily N-acetyltransferase